MSARQQWWIFIIQGCNAKHRPGTFCIRTGDDRGMEVKKSVVVEIFMNGKSHGMPDSQYGAKRVCSRPQMGNLAKELKAVPLFLQRIGLGICCTVNFNVACLNFDTLPLSHRFDKDSLYGNTTAGCDQF